MSTLEVSFPDAWAVLPGGAAGRAQVAELLGRLEAELGAEARAAFAEYLTELLPAFGDIGVDGFASLALEVDGALVQAFCAIAVVAAGGADLRAVAQAGPHPGLERETTTVELPLGPAVRSSAFRFAEELLDDDGVAPYAAEVRFAFPLAGDRVGVLHFETLSLVYYEELAALFDAIARTARVA